MANVGGSATFDSRCGVEQADTETSRARISTDADNEPIPGTVLLDRSDITLVFACISRTAGFSSFAFQFYRPLVEKTLDASFGGPRSRQRTA